MSGFDDQRARSTEQRIERLERLVAHLLKAHGELENGICNLKKRLVLYEEGSGIVKIKKRLDTIEYRMSKKAQMLARARDAAGATLAVQCTRS